MTVHRSTLAGRRVLGVGVVGLALLLAACGSGSSSDPSPAASGAAPSASAPAEEQGAIDAATLPVTLTYQERADHIVVDTGFGTDETFPMMLDTGAPLNVSADLVTQFGFPVIGQQQAQAGGGTITSDKVGVDTVTMGGLTVNTVVGISPWVDSSNPLSCVTEHGLVGGNAMSDAVWQIDYQAKTVTVSASTDGIDHVDGAITIPYQPQQGLGETPIVGFALGSAGLPFIVDTGSSFGIVAAPADLERVGVTIPADAPTVQSRITGAAGAFDVDLAYVTSSLGLNETTSIEYPIAAGDIVEGVGNIGNAFLSQFVVTFDFPNATIYLDPISEDGKVAPPTIPGATVGWDGTTAIVSSVAVGSDADRAGLKLGDVVTEADGKPITTQPEFCATFTGPDIAEITTESGTYDAGIVEDFFTVQ
jgi:hypothetical protein